MRKDELQQQQPLFYHALENACMNHRVSNAYLCLLYTSHSSRYYHPFHSYYSQRLAIVRVLKDYTTGLSIQKYIKTT